MSCLRDKGKQCSPRSDKRMWNLMSVFPIRVKQVRSRSGPTFRWALYWFQLVCKDYKQKTQVGRFNQHKPNILFERQGQTVPTQIGNLLGYFACLFVCLLLFFQSHLFRKVLESIKHIGSRSSPTYCRACYGSIQFTKVVSAEDSRIVRKV